MTPEQYAAGLLRLRYRKMLDALEEVDSDAALSAAYVVLRRLFLREPGVELLGTKTRRRAGKTERSDLIRYRQPGGPQRPSYMILRWCPVGLSDEAYYLTAREARAWFGTWGRFPGWYERPVLLELWEEMADEVTVMVPDPGERQA